MNDLVSPQLGGVSEWYSRAVTSLMWHQRKILDAQYGAGIELLGTMTGAPAAASALKSLEQRALERVRKGLPPPREVYDAQYRGRVDWSLFPDWARPTDPEVFEGSAHEG
jgi:hypothetical protein